MRLRLAILLSTCVLASLAQQRIGGGSRIPGGHIFNASTSAVASTVVTPTQAIISFTAADTGDCIILVSEESDYSPVVNDLSTTHFGSTTDDCNRTGNVIDGTSVTAVIGKFGEAGVADSNLGWKVTRALELNRLHYWKATTADGMTTYATGEFTTANWQYGYSRGEPQLAGSTPLSYNYPATNCKMNPSTVDPSTGLKYYHPCIQGWAYGRALGTSTTGIPFLAVSGTNWSPTTSTLTAAAGTDDSNYAEYSGTTADWLRLRLGTNADTKFPYDSNHAGGQGLAFQNFIVKANCLGAGCGTPGSEVEVCPSDDVTETTPVCAGPLRTITLNTTTDTTIRVCHDAPCTTANDPGDVMVFDAQKPVFTGANTVSKISAGKVYTASGSGSATLTFTNVDDCTRLFAGETISAYVVGGSPADQTRVIDSTNCGSLQATLTVAADWDVNGTGGIPFFYPTSYNTPRYGFLLRKKNNTASATIRVNLATWRGAVSKGRMSLAVGSGGFGKRCSQVVSANGFYRCHTDGGIVYGVKYESNGSVTLRNLGFLYYRPDVLGVAGGAAVYSNCIAGSNDFMWDDADPNVFYCEGTSNYADPWGTGLTSRKILMKMTYTGNDVACGAADPDGGEIGSRWGCQFAVTAVNLTPCLNSCTMQSDDYTPYGQFRRISADYDQSKFPNCSADAVTNKSVQYACRSGQQDSFAQLFVLDIGDGDPWGGGYAASAWNSGGQQVYGYHPVYNKRFSSWCGIHTYQTSLGGSNEFAVMESNSHSCPMRVQLVGTMSSCSVSGTGTCDPCPAITLDGVDYTGKDWCDTIDVQSPGGSWNTGAWGTQPGGWNNGDPVGDAIDTSQCGNIRWLKGWQVGDFLGTYPAFTGGSWEMLKVIQVTDANTLVVERGFGNRRGDSFYAPKAHSNLDYFVAMCACIDENGATSNPELDGGGIQWFYKEDPLVGTPSLYSYWTWYVNHAMNAFGMRVKPKGYGSLTSWTDYAAMVDQRDEAWTFDFGNVFAGKTNNGCAGNACETHLTISNFWGTLLGWMDIHPNLFGATFGATNVTVENVTGNLFATAIASTAIKQYDIQAYGSGLNLRPTSSTIGGTSADTGLFCVAIVANRCVSGSTAGKVYFNYTQFDASHTSCRQAEFAILQGDICIGETTMMHGTLSQWRATGLTAGMTSTNGQAGRIIGRLFRQNRESATENVKLSPDGKVVLFRSPIYATVPPNTTPDGVDRTGFLTRSKTISGASIPMGTTRVLVKFGYDSTFACSRNATDACYAVAGTVTQATPYLWEAERVNGSGVTWSSGDATVAIAALPGRMLYWQAVFTDGAGNSTGTGAVNVEAVN